MSNTPETDAKEDASYNFAELVVPSDFARKLERERDDYIWRCRVALGERDSWRMRAEQKYSMRRELEELLGVDSNSASDEQFMKGLDSLKKIIRERDEARADAHNYKERYHIYSLQADFIERKLNETKKQIKELISIARRAISLAEIDVDNDKFGIVSELRYELNQIIQEEVK